MFITMEDIYEMAAKEADRETVNKIKEIIKKSKYPYEISVTYLGFLLNKLLNDEKVPGEVKYAVTGAYLQVSMTEDLIRMTEEWPDIREEALAFFKEIMKIPHKRGELIVAAVEVMRGE